MSAAAKAKITIILANLGTPDSPAVPAVRQFLKQFLSDQRVIEIPKPVWLTDIAAVYFAIPS